MNPGSLIVIALLFALFWLFLIRPQRRRQVEQERVLAQLEVGDEVVTAGGIYGEIVELEGDEVRLEIAPGTRVRLARRAVAAVMEDDEDELSADDDELVVAESSDPIADDGAPDAARRES